MIHKHILRGCRVLGVGAISPFGTIRILSADAPVKPEDFADPLVGLELYSDFLHIHRHGKHYAGIFGDSVKVFEKATNVLAGTLTRSDLAAVDMDLDNHRVHVLPSGYLGHIQGSEYARHSPRGYVEQLAKALDDAVRGIEPSFCDNSPFTRVSPELAGQTLVCLQLNGNRRLVFTEDGTRVPSETDAPLSYEHWRKPLPRLKSEHPFRRAFHIAEP